MPDFEAATAALDSALSPTMTPTKLAEELGVTPQAVHNWRSGRARPDAKLRKRIEELLGIPRTSWLTDAEREAAGLPKAKAGRAA
jgi:transcriptional regulator with XRE-family HTH domain